VLFEEFALIQRLHLDDFPFAQIGDEGRLMLERLPLAGRAYVYQDSSGGENWYHRTHMNRARRIPLRFRGYEIVHEGKRIARGDRFSGWLDLADIRWGCAVGIRDFWQNFPSALAAEANGTLSVALWPRQFGDDHELMAGEEKTHEALWYFRAHPPYPRQVMAALQSPLQAWAPTGVYLSSGELGRHVPYDVEEYPGPEQVWHGAILTEGHNFATDREQTEEYGWRNFGDVWAENERDRTGGPRDGERVVSHFNLEYDEGWGMLLQAIRTLDARPGLAQEWWRYGREALLHEADIDIHHSSVASGENPAWAGGMQTHTDHGVEAERSAHTGRPTKSVYGTLTWEWGPGGGPESGHFNTRGLMTAYYLTGQRRFLDAAMELAELVAYKIENDEWPQIDRASREAGNNIQILTDAYLLTWDERYRRLIAEVVEACHFKHTEWARNLPDSMGGPWSLAICLKAIARYCDVVALVEGRPPDNAVSSLVGYCRAIAHAAATTPQRGWGRPGGRASDALMQAARHTDSEADRATFVEAAEQAFEDGWRSILGDSDDYVYHNAKTTTIAFTSGGEWMYRRAHPEDWVGRGPP
jgi:hypothetical protein